LITTIAGDRVVAEDADLLTSLLAIENSGYNDQVDGAIITRKTNVSSNPGPISARLTRLISWMMAMRCCADDSG
jgi:hypothetical protein